MTATTGFKHFDPTSLSLFSAPTSFLSAWTPPRPPPTTKTTTAKDCNQAGQKLDKRLAELGGRRLGSRGDADERTGFHEVDPWCDELWTHLAPDDTPTSVSNAQGEIGASSAKTGSGGGGGEGGEGDDRRSVADENRALAAAALRTLASDLGCDDRGLDLAFWPCRFEVMRPTFQRTKLTVVIDGAHNDDRCGSVALFLFLFGWGEGADVSRTSLL